MGDSIRGLTVILDSDYNQETTDRIINAIMMCKGVRMVTPKINKGNDFINRQTIKNELENKLWKVLQEVK